MLYRDRTQAGKALAAKLRHYIDHRNLIVLALPRGGVPVAFEIASALHAPLDVFIVRKLGTPGHEELAMGAIATGGIRVLNEGLVRSLEIPEWVIAEVAAKEAVELERRELKYRHGKLPLNLSGKEVILVDDGLATGATMRAAVRSVKTQNPQRLIVAVPVSEKATCEEFLREVDEVVCGATPAPFQGVGQWYENFTQTTDDEVRRLLDRAADKKDDAA